MPLLNKAYLGTTEVTKAYLGSTAVLEPSAGGGSPAGATRHWTFGSDNTAMTDSIASDTLVKQGSNPTHSAGFMETVAGNNNGMLSSYGTAGDFSAVFVVDRITSNVGTGISATGTYLESFDGASPRRGCLIRTNTNELMVATPNGGSSDLPTFNSDNRTGFYFYGVSFSGTTLKVFVGDATANKEFTHTMPQSFGMNPSRTVAIGNARNGTAFDNPIKFAEVIFWGSALDFSDFASLYTARKPILEARGISIL